MNTYAVKRTIIGRLDNGADLYEGITRIAQENSIRVGRVTGMGSVHRARLAYYDQKTMKYSDIEINQPMEIVSMYGNVSLKDGQPFAHLHVVLADDQGNGKGGHFFFPSGTLRHCYKHHEVISIESAVLSILS